MIAKLNICNKIENKINKQTNKVKTRQQAEETERGRKTFVNMEEGGSEMTGKANVCEKKLVEESETVKNRYSPLCRQVGFVLLFLFFFFFGESRNSSYYQALQHI